MITQSNEMMIDNAKKKNEVMLQAKKNAVRRQLKELGILKREGENKYDKYSYFSEAQYKMLFTRLFSENGLEFKASEVDYTLIEGTEKQAQGRLVKMEFELIDVDTGFSEKAYITGEGFDKGDKAGFKAMTGAVKYYFATNFLVATGDEAEKESPEVSKPTRRGASQSEETRKASEAQIRCIKDMCTEEQIDKLKEKYKLDKIEDISAEKAGKILQKLRERNNG